MAESDLDARLATMSTGPGVYLLKDAHGKVIYVGKAANLRSRVRSYVRGGDERSQVRFLVGRRPTSRRSSRRTRRKR
jgi:excinuclease ABC subunit C